VEILIAASGLKVRGEKASWIKLHIAVDPKTQELIAIEVTDDQRTDCTIFPKLIDNSPTKALDILAFNVKPFYFRSQFQLQKKLP
jgi:hypothetical protein